MKRILAFVFMGLMFLHSTGMVQAQSLDDYIDSLKVCIDEYKRTNDQLLVKQPLEEWTQCYNMTHERSARYAMQARAFNHLVDSLLQATREQELPALSDTLTFDALIRDEKIAASNLRYKLVRLGFELYIYDQSFYDDLFVAHLLNKVLPDLEAYMPQSEVTISAVAIVGRSYKSMTYLELDDISRKCVDYSERVVEYSESHPNPSSIKVYYLECMSYITLLSPWLLEQNFRTVEQYNNDLHKAIAFQQRTEHLFEGDEMELYQAIMKRDFKDYVSRTILGHFATSHIQNEDPEMQVYITNYLKDELEKLAQGDSSNYYVCSLLKAYSGASSYDVECENSMAFYRKHPLLSDTLTIHDLVEMSGVMPILCSLNRFSETRSEKERHDVNAYLAGQVEGCFEAGVNPLYQSFLSLPAIRFAIYPNLVAYLSYDEKIAHLKRMTKYLSVKMLTQTYLSNKLTAVLLKALQDRHPEMLVGTHGLKSVKDVKKNAKQLQQFMEVGTMLHDMGLNYVTNLFNGYYYPVTELEQMIYKSHTERGVATLSLDPRFKAYKDLVLGHHKWYNGLRGYPDWFNNSLSADHLLIDIMGVCDFLVTPIDENDQVLFSKVHNFDALLSDMDRLKGKRFNAELLNLMHTDSALHDAMEQIVNEGWKQCYYDVYFQ